MGGCKLKLSHEYFDRSNLIGILNLFQWQFEQNSSFLLLKRFNYYVAFERTYVQVGFSLLQRMWLMNGSKQKRKEKKKEKRSIGKKRRKSK